LNFAFNRCLFVDEPFVACGRLIEFLASYVAAGCVTHEKVVMPHDSGHLSDLSSTDQQPTLSIVGINNGIYATSTLAWLSFALYSISLLWALRKVVDRCRTDAAQRRWRSAIVSSSALLTPSGSMPSLTRYAQEQDPAYTKYAHYSSAASSYHSASSSPGLTTTSGSYGSGGGHGNSNQQALTMGVWPAHETVHDPSTLWMISIFPTFLALSFACRLIWVALVGLHDPIVPEIQNGKLTASSNQAIELLSFEQSTVNRIALLFYFTAYSFIGNIPSPILSCMVDSY
jgi:hypothetical protein